MSHSHTRKRNFTHLQNLANEKQTRYVAFSGKTIGTDSRGFVGLTMKFGALFTWRNCCESQLFPFFRLHYISRFKQYLCRPVGKGRNSEGVERKETSFWGHTAP